jgi:hypothetical protein
MKKIYSFVLLATAMLLSISVKADSKADLLAAFNHAGDGSIHNVTLTANVTMDQPLLMYANYAEDGDIINLNLNGFNIQFTSTDANGGFVLYKGTLNITGAGQIETSSAQNLFMIYGSPVQDDANWTNLNIGQDVRVLNTLTAKKARAISINGFYGKHGKYISVDDLGAENLGKDVTDYYTNADGSLARTAVSDRYRVNTEVSGSDPLFVAGSIDYVTSFPYYKSATKSLKPTTGGSKISMYTKSSVNEYAYGVNVEIAGYVYGTNYGVKPNGNLRSNEGNVPYIHVASTAHIECAHDNSASTAVYSSGYSQFLIEGRVEGSTGVYIKSGEVEINNATIIATNPNYQTAEAAAANTSGVDASGCGIVVESNPHYAGGQSVTISGDTRITGAGGYAVEEVINTNDGQPLVSQIEIEGGIFEGGNEGAMRFENNTTEEQLVTIYGATVGGDVEINGAEPEETATILAELAPNSTEYHVTVVDNIVVVSAGAAPEEAADDYDINDAQDGDAVAFVSGTSYTIDEQELNKDLVLEALEMNADEPMTLTIISGNTLEVGHIVMNSNAKIIVETDAKLIVTGEQGMVASSVENLLIKAEEGHMGLFLFNPAVTSNKHPHGTVELISKAYKDGNHQVWQRFGVPAWEGITRANIIRTNPSYFKYWDQESGWKDVATDQVMLPFEGYELSINTNDPGALYTFKCDALFGNVNATLNFPANHGWGYFANSYTGELDIAAVLAKLAETNKAEGALHFNLSSTDNYWRNITIGDYEDFEEGIISFPISKIAPMQCFVTRTLESVEEPFTDALNYEAMVWNHRNENNHEIVASNAAPARRNMMAADYTRASIVIANGENEQIVTLRQSARFSDEFDNGYDASLFKAGNFNIYANDELAQIATDNLMGTTLSVEAAKAASFKMTFEGLRGETLAIRDNMTGTVINMTEGEEYFFSVAPGTAADRFEIVEAAKMPTDVEALKAAPAKKGIYTLVGQYLGEDFDVLPAGIYVVNGKKVVK